MDYLIIIFTKKSGIQKSGQHSPAQISAYGRLPPAQPLLQQKFLPVLFLSVVTHSTDAQAFNASHLREVRGGAFLKAHLQTALLCDGSDSTESQSS